jgi:hypothetical protein
MSLVALTVTTMLSVLTVQSASARSFVIEVRGGSQSGRSLPVKRIGDLRPNRDASLAAAIRAYGRPYSRRENGGGCRVVWRRLGIRMLASDFSAAGSPCDPSVGDVQVVTLRSRRWHTRRGLRVGQTPRQLRRLYPRARRAGRSYRIVVVRSPIANYAVLSARLNRRGRISSLRLFVGGAGE